MNLNHFEAIALVQKIAFSLPDKYFDKVDVTVIPPFTDLRSVQTLVDGDKLRLTYGAQDVSQHDSGAYTGEISGAFLAKLGCTFAVVGHSERRTYHDEDDALVAAKAAAALKHGLTPIVCIGEQLEVREAGDHVEYNVNSAARLAGRAVGRADRPSRHRLRAGLGDRHRPGGQRRRRAGGLRGHPRRAGRRWRRRTSPPAVRVLYGGSVNAKNVGEIVGAGRRRRRAGRRRVAGRRAVRDAVGDRRGRAAARDGGRTPPAHR